MKRFSFPLDRVRRWRAEQASVEELKLRELMARLAALGDEKGGVQLERAQSEREVLAQPSIEARELQSLEAFRRHTGNRVRDIENRQRQCQAQVLEQRQRFIQAKRQAELLERLKQKALEEWTTASDREQENLATELYLAKRRPASRHGS